MAHSAAKNRNTTSMLAAQEENSQSHGFGNRLMASLGGRGMGAALDNSSVVEEFTLRRKFSSGSGQMSRPDHLAMPHSPTENRAGTDSAASEGDDFEDHSSTSLAQMYAK